MMRKTETATFAGGCFWCTEAIFQRLEGVASVTPGYSGGSMNKPGYEDVSTGSTGHAEAIQIKFDPKKINYAKLLEVFFRTHDPTTKDRQGADVGTQYRSEVFYHSNKQKELAEEAIKKIEEGKVYGSPVVTKVEPFESFYEAEDYHKNYYNNNKNAMYCKVVINPKLKKLEKLFGDLVKK